MKGLKLVAWGLVLFAAPRARGDSTWVYAVQVSAAVEMTPPRIILYWPQDTYGAVSYTVYRKNLEDTGWGTGTLLPGTATNYTDFAVAPGAAYEYQIHKAAVLGYSGYGYIYAGLAAPAVEDRGAVILVVENAAATALPSELARLESDLCGDGWRVVRHDVSAGQTPESVRALIVSDYQADPERTRAVFLFGRVPVLYSGNLDWDTHGPRPMPADGYYGDIDGDWSASPDTFPSSVELMVGRVDLSNMPGTGAVHPWPGETELLRNYLNKNHRWRHGEMPVQRRSLMGNRRGDEWTSAPAASGYRAFAPSTGPALVEANVQDNAPAAERWISHLASGSWLWAYGCGGGQPFGLSGLGTHGMYHDVLTTDLRDDGAKAAFAMLFGSYIADWQRPDNFMRGFLATEDYGLAACMAGRPHWFAHHSALGEPIGYGARVTMNNASLYRNNSNTLPQAVYISLMGDPTLRTEVVRPPSAANVTTNSDRVQVSWTASPDAAAGYHVYRAASPAGPFNRLNPEPVAGTSFFEVPPAGRWTYLVRALKLEQGFSGTYYNLSQGVSAGVSWGAGNPGTNDVPIRVRARAEPGTGLLLEWNSVPGGVYRVQGNSGLHVDGWVALSGPVGSDSTNASWSDPKGVSEPRGFYRVLREN